MPRDVKAYLSKKKVDATDEDIAHEWAEIDEFYSKRLWHQLTLKLQKFLCHECFKTKDRVEMYESFIADFEHKINPLSLMEIAVVVSKEMEGGAIAFLTSFKEKVKTDHGATILCMTALGTILLQQNKLDDVKIIVEETGQLLEYLSGITAVHAEFYELSSGYHKAKSNYESYYRDALRYLGCVDVTSFPASEQSERAFHLGLAALLAEKVYNFGEILSHSVIDSLRGTENTWMIKLLHAFNSGDMCQFEALRPFWEQQPDLLKNQAMLRRKIQLLSLMEAAAEVYTYAAKPILIRRPRDSLFTASMVFIVVLADYIHVGRDQVTLIFKRHAHDRTVSFSAIANGAQIDVMQVEELMMKALSLGLVGGSIDEVREEATMTWVQPRVLNKEQANTLQCRITQWCRDINDTVCLMKVEIPDVAVHL